MLLPLRIGERTIGSLNFSHTTGAYSVLWRNLASLLASQVGGQLGTVLQLKRACEFRERVMESVADAIYTLDLEGKFTLVNQRTADITGYSVEELIGRSFLTLFYPQEANQIQSLFSATIECGASINQYEAELVTKDGSRKNITACKYKPACGEISMSIHYYNPQSSAMTQRSARQFAQRGEPPHTTGSGDGSGRAPAQAQCSTPATVFSIRNSAEIPTLELPRIFEKFYRVNHADPWKQGGTGLGLALVQKLVKQLQGTIQVESFKGWTTFTVQLPNKPV